jgi:hypothetical protein
MLKVASSLDKLSQRIQKHKKIPQIGRQWAKDAAKRTTSMAKANLESQGRGGQGPPLSSATIKIYAQSGEPDGSGIRNHIETTEQSSDNHFTAVSGILSGKPTLIAKVQDRGAVIKVTDAMRGFLAAHGVFLKASTTEIFIPPRYFWTMAVRDSKKVAKQQMRKFMRS